MVYNNHQQPFIKVSKVFTKMSSAYIRDLVNFDGYKTPDFIPEGPTQRIWSNMGIAIKKGATWGDFAVYTREELFEVLEERAARSKKLKNGDLVPTVSAPTVSVPIFQQVVERAAPSIVIPYKEEAPFVPVAKKETLRAKLDKFLTPKPVRALCLGCGKFCVHSKPPDNWNASDRKRYCCLGCRDSAGKKHADRCQKHTY